MKSDNKQRLFEMMNRMDSSFKPIIKEYEEYNQSSLKNDYGFEDEPNNVSVEQGDVTLDKLNSIHREIIQIKDNADMRLEKPLNNALLGISDSIRILDGGVNEEQTPNSVDYSGGEFFEDKLGELLQQMREHGIEYDTIIKTLNRIYPEGQGELLKHLSSGDVRQVCSNGLTV